MKRAMWAAVSLALCVSASAQQRTPEQRAWLDDSCPRSLGPSLWRRCMDREGAALASPPNSQLNHLTERQKRWLAQACPHSIGPSLHRRCVERETTALVAPGWPDVDTLPTDQRSWLLESCPSSLGPSLWRRCAEREMAALRPQVSPSAPPVNPTPVPSKTLEKYAAPIPSPRAGLSATKPVAVPAASVVETQVDGEFSGWEGETIIKLMNGQIWQQTEYRYEYHYAYMPKVLVYPSSGGFKMKVDGVSQPVGVERLR
jgi:hypothetical protein